MILSLENDKHNVDKSVNVFYFIFIFMYFILFLFNNFALQNKSVTDLMNPVALDHAQRCESYKKLTRTLMDSIFSLEEMTTCSVTGKKGVVGEKRKSLDLEKVQLVIGKHA